MQSSFGRITLFFLANLLFFLSYEYSPNSVSTLRGSYGRSKGRCLIRVVTLGASICCKFSYKVALVKFPSAF